MKSNNVIPRRPTYDARSIRHDPDQEPHLTPHDRSDAAYNGDVVLQSLGYKPQLPRNRSTWQVAVMAFVLASVPYGLSTTLSNPITGGGPVNMIWGWVAVSALIACVAASLGEITSIYPVAGGMMNPLSGWFGW